MNFSFRLKPNHCSQSFDYIFDSIRMATDYCHSCDPICGLLLHLCHNYERNGLLCACISLGCIQSSGRSTDEFDANTSRRKSDTIWSQKRKWNNKKKSCTHF
jgi:hypothetical protein